MEYFRTSVAIRAPLETLFDFFTNPENLRKVTPPAFGLVVEDADLPLRLGSRVRLRMRVGLIPIRWELSVRSLKRGDRFIDWQEHGPFREWRHTHLFERSADATRVIDMVEYEVPYGFLGSLMHRIFIRPSIEGYFRYRQERLVELFGPARESARGHDSLRGRRGRGGTGEREGREREGRERDGRGGRGERRAPASAGGERRRSGGGERPGRGERGEGGERVERVERGERGERAERGGRGRGSGRGGGRAGEDRRDDRSLARAAERILERERLERLRDLEGAEDEIAAHPGGIEFEMEEEGAPRDSEDVASGESGTGERRKRRRRGGRRRRGAGSGDGGEGPREAIGEAAGREPELEERARTPLDDFEAEEPTEEAVEPEGREERGGRGRSEPEREEREGRRERGGRGRDRERGGRGERRGESRGDRGPRRGRDGREDSAGAPAREAPTFLTIYPPPRESSVPSTPNDESPSAPPTPDLPQLILPEQRSRSAWGRSPQRASTRRPEAPKEEPPVVSTPPAPQGTESGGPEGD